MPQEVQKTGPDLAGITDILHVIASVHLTCFTPLLVTGMGCRALSVTGPCALIWMLAYAQFTYCGPLILYLGPWLLACFVQSVFLRDRRQHSRYTGYPLLCRFVSNEGTARTLGALLLGGVGLGLLSVNEPLGHFVMGGGVAGVIKEAIEATWRQKMALDMHDAGLEAQQWHS
jgi:hypothetical protein